MKYMYIWRAPDSAMEVTTPGTTLGGNFSTLAQDKRQVSLLCRVVLNIPTLHTILINSIHHMIDMYIYIFIYT